jgi:hypothetical protein
LRDQRKPGLILVPQGKTDAVRIVPKGFGLFEIDAVLFGVGAAFGRVVFELHAVTAALR